MRVGGGANVIRQYLKVGLVDEMHLAVNPVLLGAGETLLSGLDAKALGFARIEFAASQKAAHYVLKKQG